MPRPMRRLARRVTNRLVAPYVADLDARMGQLDGRMGELSGKIDLLQASLGPIHGDLRDEVRGAAAEVRAEVAKARQTLRHVYDEDPAQRRRLYALRASEEYELAFTEPEPLVSFVVPTHTRFESLRDVSLPSILAQTYANVEVVVAGDAAPPETARVIAELDDPRIRYCNRTVRGPYPDDPAVRWYMIGTPPYNDGVALARGRWIASLGDDDAVRPDHTERLLEAARRERYEHCYGLHTVHYKSGETLEVGTFPPELGQYVLQASIYHAGLRFFQLEPVDHLYAEPNDWSLCRRMLQAGVRFGMVDRVLVDKYENRYESHDGWSIHGIPSVE